jgi:hypothetical protein
MNAVDTEVRALVTAARNSCKASTGNEGCDEKQRACHECCRGEESLALGKSAGCRAIAMPTRVAGLKRVPLNKYHNLIETD